MRIAILAGLALLGGCAAGHDTRRLQGEWRAVDLNGFPVSGPRAPTLRLGGGDAGGTGGCNSWTSTYRLETREGMRFGPIASTKMACEGPVMDQESRYFSILSKVQGYSLYGDGSLSLIAADGSAVRFRR